MTRAAIWIGVLGILGASAAEYHVSPQGRDDGTGAAEAPFRTIGQAAALLEPGDTCVIHAGTYRETVTLPRSGEPGRPIRLVGQGKVIISALEPFTPEWKAENGVWTAAVDPVPTQLFFAGQMAREAHTPNGEFPDLLDHPCFRAEADTGYEGITCKQLPEGDYTGGYVMIWRGGAWTNATVRIKDYVPGQSLAFDPPFEAHSDKYHQGDAFKPHAGNRFFLLGCRAALDIPGEWLAEEGRVLFVPPPDKQPGELAFEVKARDETLVLRERSHVEVSGLCLQGGVFDMNGASDCRLERVESTFSNHFGRTARKLPPYPVNQIAGDRNVLEHCLIAYAAGSGLVVTGEGNRILNSVFHDLGYMGTYDPALKVDRSKGTVIERCSLYRAGRGLIQHHGAEAMRIAYCDLHHANLLSNDVGATYAWGTDGKGSVIAYNWVHHNLGGNTAGIYLDNFCRNFVVHHNLVWQCESTAIRLNSDATGHLVANNTVAQTPNAFSTFTYHAYTPTQEGTRLVNNLVLCAFEPTNPRHVVQGEKGPVLEANLTAAVGADGVPAADSAAVDAGIGIPGITDGFVGQAPDVGAYERGGTYWRPGADWDPNPTVPDLAFIPQAPISAETMPRDGLLLWLDGKSPDTLEVTEGGLRRWRDRLRPDRAAVAGSGFSLLPEGGVHSAGESGLKVGTLRAETGPAIVFLVARSDSAEQRPWQRIFVSWAGQGNDWVAPSFQQMRPGGQTPALFPWTLFKVQPRDPVVLDHITLASSAQENGQNFIGDVAEVLVFGKQLPFDQEKAIIDYLKQKWNLR
jgi:hypothetical protein